MNAPSNHASPGQASPEHASPERAPTEHASPERASAEYTSPKQASPDHASSELALSEYTSLLHGSAYYDPPTPQAPVRSETPEGGHRFIGQNETEAREALYSEIQGQYEDPRDAHEGPRLFHDAVEHIRELKRQVNRQGSKAGILWAALMAKIESSDEEEEKPVAQQATPRAKMTKYEPVGEGRHRKYIKGNDRLVALYDQTKFPTKEQMRELAAEIGTTLGSIRDRFATRRSIRGDTRYGLLDRAFSDDPDPSRSDLVSLSRQAGMSPDEVEGQFANRRQALIYRAFQFNPDPSRSTIVSLSQQTGLSFAEVQGELARRRQGNSAQRQYLAPESSNQTESTKETLKRKHSKMEDGEEDLTESPGEDESEDDANEEEGEEDANEEEGEEDANEEDLIDDD